jgi:O-antigen/teichoic acid export membrane protein
MRRYLSRLGVQTGVYGLGRTVNASMAVLLMPIYTYHLEPDSYGLFELLAAAGLLLQIVLECGLTMAMTRQLLREGLDHVRRIYSTVVIFSLTLTAGAVAAIWAFDARIATLLLGNGRHAEPCRLLLAAAVMRNVHTYPLTLYRVQNRAMTYAVLSFAGVALQLGLIGYFVIGLDAGLNGLARAQFLYAVIFAAVLLAGTRAHVAAWLSWNELRGLLRVGLPLVPAAIGLVVIATADRYFLEAYSGLEQVGIYSVAARIALGLGMLVAAFHLAWPNVLYGMANDPMGPRLFARVITYVALASCAVALCLALLADEVVALIAPDAYAAAAGLVGLTVMAQLLFGLFVATTIGPNVTGKTGYTAAVVTAGASLHLALNWVLVPRWAGVGAAWAALLASFFLLAASSGVSQRLYHVPYEWLRLGKIAAAALVVYGAGGIAAAVLSPWAALGAKVLLLAGFAALLRAFRFFDDAEMVAVGGWLGRAQPAATAGR